MTAPVAIGSLFQWQHRVYRVIDFGVKALPDYGEKRPFFALERVDGGDTAGLQRLEEGARVYVYDPPLTTFNPDGGNLGGPPVLSAFVTELEDDKKGRWLRVFWTPTGEVKP